jgi:thiamine biosynthesis lipoprotein ApbE
VLPVDEAIKLVENTDDLEAVIEDAQGKIYISPGLKDKFTLAK